MKDFDQTVFGVNDMTMWKAAENIAKAMNMVIAFAGASTVIFDTIIVCDINN